MNVANKPDSQDICFVPNGDYASVIKKFKPSSFKKGDIVDLKGNKVGEHEGIINFTIGQRKGIKVAGEEAFYVLKINAKKNQIIIGPKDALGINKIFLKELNLFEDLSKCSNIFVKVRSTGKFLKAKINTQSQKATVYLNSSETGVSPGQACVFYEKDKLGDKVLGAGWISSNSNWLSPLLTEVNNSLFRSKSDAYNSIYFIVWIWIKRQLLTGQLRKGREAEAQRAESLTE